MAKFSKKLRKIKKHLSNCVVIGTAFENIDELLEVFDTVFILGATTLTVRQKNIIYVKDVAYVSSFFDVDMIFVDQDKLQDMKFLAPLLSKSKPVIFIEGAEIISNEYAQCIKYHNYEVVELEKKYQIWKVKRQK